MEELLLIRPGAIGDTLMAAPALRVLPAEFKVTFVGRRPGLDFIRPLVHKVLDLESYGWQRLFTDGPHPGSLPVLKADRVTAFFTDSSGAIQTNLAGYFPRSPVAVFPPYPPESERTHVAFHVAACLRSAGLPVDPRAAVEKATGRAVLIAGKTEAALQNTIVLHPGSGGQKKNRPPEFWLELVKRLIGRDGRRAVILLGPAEERLYLLFEPYADDKLGILYYPDSQALLSFLGSSALYIGHDSGITHLAAMCGVPSIAVFRHSDPQQWRPLGPKVRIIEDQGDREVLLEKTLNAAHTLTLAF
jgi:ADP-heptose:LPS heptosyltransferase